MIHVFIWHDNKPHDIYLWMFKYAPESSANITDHFKQRGDAVTGLNEKIELSKNV